MLRLFTQWNETEVDDDKPSLDRVEVPEISIMDMFDDGFTAISRDGAGVVEVAVRLQKALHSLATIGSEEMREAAHHHGLLALKRAQIALEISEDMSAVRDAAKFAESTASLEAQQGTSLSRN